MIKEFILFQWIIIFLNFVKFITEFKIFFNLRGFFFSHEIYFSWFFS